MNAVTIGIAGRKGGTGKTTTAVTLADLLARRLVEHGADVEKDPFQVLLIDLDPQGNVSTAMGVDTGGRCVGRMLTGEAGLEETMIPASTAEHARPGLWLLPSTPFLARAKGTILARFAAEQAANAVIGSLYGAPGTAKAQALETTYEAAFGALRGAFKWIIVDNAPTVDLLEAALYSFLDHVIVPVKVDMLSISGALQHTEELAHAGGRARLLLAIPTFYRIRMQDHREKVSALAAAYRGKVAVPIPMTTEVERAPDFGMTLPEYAEHTGREMGALAVMAYRRAMEKLIT